MAVIPSTPSDMTRPTVSPSEQVRCALSFGCVTAPKTNCSRIQQKARNAANGHANSTAGLEARAVTGENVAKNDWFETEKRRSLC